MIQHFFVGCLCYMACKDSFVEDLTLAGVDPSLLHKIDISDPEGLESFLSSLEENFNGTVSGVIPGRSVSSSNIKTKLLNWADQQGTSERRKEIHSRVAEFIKKLEASQEQTFADKSIKKERSAHSLQDCTESGMEEKREDTEEEIEENPVISQTPEDICILGDESEHKDTEPSLSVPEQSEISIEHGSEENELSHVEEHAIEVPQIGTLFLMFLRNDK